MSPRDNLRDFIACVLSHYRFVNQRDYPAVNADLEMQVVIVVEGFSLDFYTRPASPEHRKYVGTRLLLMENIKERWRAMDKESPENLVRLLDVMVHQAISDVAELMAARV
jgi:hypothetical protein